MASIKNARTEHEILKERIPNFLKLHKDFLINSEKVDEGIKKQLREYSSVVGASLPNWLGRPIHLSDQTIQ